MVLEHNIKELGLERLREVLDYDPVTGHLIWRVSLSPRGVVGARAGCVKGGYRKITIDGVSYPASHIAWFHHYGKLPKGLVDHKNRNRDDNWIENLREATNSQNSYNMGRNSANTTGFKGVSKFYNPTNTARFRAQIRVNGKRLFLGLFHTPEEAHEAYRKKAAELHGEFARVT